MCNNFKYYECYARGCVASFPGLAERVQFYTALGFDLPLSNRNLVGRTSIAYENCFAVPILDAANVNECAIHSSRHFQNTYMANIDANACWQLYI
eukprot:scaffold2127_cov85-Cylindrotheca_fusiformis.AAC.11